MTEEAVELVREYKVINKERVRLDKLFLSVDEYFNTQIIDWQELERELRKVDEELILEEDPETCSTCKHEIYFSFEEDERTFWCRDCGRLNQDAVDNFNRKIKITKSTLPIQPIQCHYYERRKVSKRASGKKRKNN